MTGADRARVLLVEDSATQAALLADLLQANGYVTSIARRAEQALELLGGSRFDLVLSDVVMPGMDGYELCRRIRALPQYNAIPVVLLTSVTDPLAIVRGLASGADHYVTKPYEPSALLSRVDAVLKRGHQDSIIHPKPFNIELLGTPFTIGATKEQILELLVSSYSDLMHTSEAVRDAERRARFLAEVTEVLSASLDVKQVLRDLAGLIVPRIADACIVDLLTTETTALRIEIAHTSPAAEPYDERDVAIGAPSRHAVESRRIDIVEEVQGSMLADITDDETLRRQLMSQGPISLVVVPLVARQRVLALLHCFSPSTGRLTAPETIALLEDMARRAALALENALLYAEAQRATQARDDVLAIVSHDLRNPINTIFMSTSLLLDLLAEPDTKPPFDQQLRIIKRATSRANSLIQDLLDVSRIDSGTLAVETKRIGAASLLADASLDLQPLVTGSGLRFESEWEGPDVEIEVDKARMAQVFSNLAGNAAKFTPRGGLVRLTGRRDAKGAVFEVCDTGTGIAADHIPHLFDRFWKATKASRTGAGLGLFIVKGVVESHGGDVEVRSSVGEGTIFRFCIPAAR